MNKDFSILVNTTDSFSDCWLPFLSFLIFFGQNTKAKFILIQRLNSLIILD